MEYVNLAAVLWLTFYTLATVSTVNEAVSTGRRIKRINFFPLILAIASLITLGIHTVKEVLA